MTTTAPPTRRAGWIVLDAVAVVAFAALGRASHAEDLAGTLLTAAPFVAGAAVGTLAGRTWRDPLAWGSGLVVWAGAVVVGLPLRAAFTGRLPVSFAIVATVSLGVLLLGWRAIARVVRSRRA
ncbi:hypothetical protein Acsp06_12320 [Actinomycetospora sp. NBRC 106375]|uniref:DUF3054 domain-containing protein n=1 Tax=Actinomycetospora sp. NBRC 106375 TaxID=3032207 RepID=UPI0024A5DE92|nr:DUF3054 domain-containing protein [Actinomycetospora sp. NBRC 106375]GLZ45047.1 hypothetical protein Acsp06_12320 [Actinomycetospora sp. NBRC 106375]